jgi:hypothetical protein
MSRGRNRSFEERRTLQIASLSLKLTKLKSKKAHLEWRLDRLKKRTVSNDGELALKRGRISEIESWINDPDGSLTKKITLYELMLKRACESKKFPRYNRLKDADDAERRRWVAENFSILRTLRGELSQGVVATAAGVHQCHVSKVERGDTYKVGPVPLLKLIEWYGKIDGCIN